MRQNGIMSNEQNSNKLHKRKPNNSKLGLQKRYRIMRSPFQRHQQNSTTSKNQKPRTCLEKVEIDQRRICLTQHVHSTQIRTKRERNFIDPS